MREALTRHCLPFAGRIARRYRGRGEPLDDLVQVARLGLVKAIARYDPARGSFTAYALTTMDGEIKRHFRDATWGVHVSRGVQNLGLQVRLVSADLSAQLRRSVTVAEIADQIGVAPGAVAEALESIANYSPASLDAPAPGKETGIPIGESLGEHDGQLDLVADKITLAALLDHLPARERHILTLRFFGNLTQAQIATELGISQMHVSRLLNRALGWMREAMLGDVTPPRSFAVGISRFEMRARSVDDTHTVEVRGEVDRDTAGRLRFNLTHAIETVRPKKILVILAEVPVIDAAGVAALADVASAASSAGIILELTRANPLVRQVLAVTGLKHLFRTAV
ncbi:SigB/SigF/SigG family RNA polymerase sigma factor [Actinoplanes sp. NPDC051411]|uniref:SigB/SigF/SigG family RNA polymerase sigma factor n=1 Tax=Actinoplanes sp. NPDC051411 TaxID=3155522 RepID=UPI00343E0A77